MAIHDSDPPSSSFAAPTAAATQVVFGILLIVIAITVDCLQLLHGILGAVMLASGIVVIVLIIQSSGSARVDASAEKPAPE